MADIATLGLRVDARDASQQVDQFGNKLRGLDAEATKSQRAVDRLNKTMRAASQAAAAAASLAASVTGYTVALGKLAERGGQVINVQRGFARTNAEAAGSLDLLVRATNGLVSRYDLMVGLNRAMTLGAARNAQEFAELSKTAIALGRALGVDAAFALESLSLGIGRQSRLILDNLGLIVSAEEAYKKYAASIGVATDALTQNQRQEAFRSAALESAREKVQELGGVVLNGADSWTQLTTEIKNARDELAALVAQSDTVINLFKELRTLIATLRGTSPAVQGTLESLSNVQDVEVLKRRYFDFFDLLPKGTRSIDENNEALKRAGLTQKDVGQILVYIEQRIAALVATQKAATSSTADLAAQQAALNEKLKELANTLATEYGPAQAKNLDESLLPTWLRDPSSLNGITIFRNLTEQSQDARRQITSDQQDISDGFDTMSQAFAIAAQAMARNSSDLVAALQDVIQMLVLMRREAQLTQAQMRGLGYAQAGLGGFGTGYSAGRGTTSRLGGTLRGAASGAAYGAAVGSVIPGVGTVVGAGIGAITGAIGGFLGASKKAKEAEEERARAAYALERANKAATEAEFARVNALIDEAKALRADLAEREAALRGDNAAAVRARYEEQARRELKRAEDLQKAGVITEEEVQRLKNVLHNELVAALVELENQARAAAEAVKEQSRSSLADLKARGLTATGQGAAGALAAFLEQQRQELLQNAGEPDSVRRLRLFVQTQELANFKTEQAIQAISNATAEQIAAYDAQINVAQEQLRTAQDQLSAQEETVRTLQQVYESLKDYSDSLLLGSASPLSPRARLDEAQRQFDALRSLALGGDVTAAQSIPGAGNALLQALRGYYGSSTGYASGFDYVRSAVEDIQRRFGQQKTVEEKTLDELRKQTERLQSQVAALEAAKAAAQADAQRQIDEIRAAAAKAQEDARKQLGALLEQVRWLAIIGTKRTDEGPGGGTIITFDAMLGQQQETTAATKQSVSVLQQGFVALSQEVSQLTSSVDKLTKTTADSSSRTRTMLQI